jgi:two-component system, cell cycle sensor histidine kinase and response regulator CckA
VDGDERMTAGDHLAAPRRIPATAISLTVVTVLAVADWLLRDVVVLGLLVVGPCLAAVSARPRTVAVVGGYVMVLIALVSGPDRLWWTLQQALYALAAVSVTAVSAGMAARRLSFERFVGHAAAHRAALAAVVDASDDAIVGKTLDGTITGWNSGASRMYGYSAEEAIGRNITFITDPAGVAELPSILARVRRGESISNYETRRRHKNGSIVHVSVSVTPVRDTSGTPVGAWAVARNLTNRVEQENERRSLQEASHQAQRLQSLGQLAGGVAHDFNNLLAVISNYAEFVAEETADRPAVQADVAEIRSATDRAAKLTAQMLTFARRETVQHQVLDLNAVVADVENLLRRTLGEHIQLIALPAARLPTIRADRGHLEQVLLNLAINARDAMADGGTLVIETRPVDLQAGQAGIQPPPAGGGYVELSVSDTGTGMSADVAAHVFEPFFTTKPKGHGTGLGLATVYGIVTEAGGSLNLYSEPGIGTTFRVYLPAVDLPACTGAAGPALEPRRGDGETILVVEDERALRDLIGRILTRNGYTVLTASDGEEALEVASRNRLDLLLTDVVMPHMSGPELNEIIQRRTPGLPVMFVSGYSNGLLGTRQMLDPGVHLIHKPFTERDLVEGVHSVISAAHSTAEPRP